MARDPRRAPPRKERPNPPSGFERIGDVLAGYLEQMGLTEEVARQEVLTRWESVVGDRVARVARANAVSGGTLFVKVDSSAWLNELNLIRHELLARINAGQESGRVERIVFTLSGERDGESRPEASRTRRREMPPGD
jgi:predicted nucleic acid-binding Zn ribbon protein